LTGAAGRHLVTRIAPRSLRLGPGWRNVLLSVHITSTVGALGADVTILALGLTGLAGSDPATVYPAMSLIGGSILAPLAVASLVTGLLLARLSTWGVFKYWWVTIKLATTTGLAVLVLQVLVPRFAAAAHAASAGIALAHADRLQLVVTAATGTTLLIVMVVLAVFKPSWRLRRADEGSRR
jgi:hypothetical protein